MPVTTGVQNDILATTLRILRDQLVDSTFKAVPLMDAVNSLGNVEKVDGGSYIDAPVILTDHSMITQLTTGYEAVSLAVKDPLRTASYSWCDAVAPVVLTRKEELSNKGERAVVRIMEARLKQTMGMFKREIEKQIVAGSSTILTDLQTLNGLDADSRYPKIRKAAIRIIRRLVRDCLECHQNVHLVIAEGNHDEEGTGWLADFFDVHYEDEPRVSVNDSALPFYVFEWGQTMLGIHHGHKVKNEALPLLFAAQFPEVWGRTKRREIHCGHRHHRDEKEYNGVTVVQHPTLAARDAYAARGGWIADRAAWAITYHKQYGAVGRVMVTPEMLNG